MEYMLTEKDVEVIKSALKAHLRQCEEMLNMTVSSFTLDEKAHVIEKINLMKELLANM